MPRLKTDDSAIRAITLEAARTGTPGRGLLATPAPNRAVPAAWWLHPGSISLIYLVLGLLIYAPVAGSFFVSDDFVYLRNAVRQQWPGVLFLQPGVFRPLHVASYLIDYWIWGLNPFGYHLTNILGHCLTALLVFLVAGRLHEKVVSEQDRVVASAAAGLIFLVQPSHTEAVSWITGRNDIFPALFVLLSWYLYLRFQTRSTPMYLVASLITFFIALLFKESAITFPLVLICEAVFLGRKQLFGGTECGAHTAGPVRWSSLEGSEFFQELLIRHSHSLKKSLLPITYIAVVAVFLVSRRVALGDFVGGYELAFVRPSFGIIPNLAATITRSFLPYAPVQLLPQPPKIGLTSAGGFAAVLVSAVVVFALLHRIRLRPTPAWRLGGFLVLTLIISTLPTIAFAPSFIDSESERYAYLPSVFASMILGLALIAVIKTRLARAATTLAVVVLLGAFLELSNQNWRTAADLSREVLAGFSTEPADAALLVPDSLNGAFIYRNGLNEALDLFGPTPEKPMPVIAQAFLRQPDEAVTLDRLDHGHYSIQVPSGRSTLRVVPAVSDSVLAATTIDLYRVDIAPRRSVRVAYYSAGKMLFTQLDTD